MSDISMKQLLEAGVHFGHQTSRWNPKMKPYIFGARNGIHIIDLQQTVTMFKDLEAVVRDLAASGGHVLFVGTKKQAQDAIREEAERCNMYYVHNRWLGGTLTNFSTIRQSIERLRKIEEMENDPKIVDALTKKEMLGLKRERAKLEQSLGGIKSMRKLPDAIFVIDPKQEEIAVKEARKLGIPVISGAVKELREKTGAGMMDCKKALGEAGGDLQKAIDYLRQKGLAAAAKKADRVAADGAVAAYVHPGGKIGVLVEVNCETDFVARTAEFQMLLKDIAMQVAAANPRYVRREQVPAAEFEKEKSIYRQQAVEAGKAEKFVDKIVEGKIERFYSEACLLEQAFIKDPDKTVTDIVNEAIARLGEKIQIRRFARYHLGEAISTE